jgi:hopanoid biosynthesis associated RND transporter like protein HpnN
VRVTGELALSTEELTTVTRGALQSGIISFFAVGIVLFIALRSGKLVLATLVTLVAGLIWTFAFAAAAIGTLNMVSVAFAVLYIGLGTDFGVHFCLRWQDLRSHGRTRDAAMRETASDVGLSLVICAATTAIGFLAFWPTDYNGVSELGLISGAGIFLSFFANLTVLPALIDVLAPAPLPAPAARRVHPWFARLGELPSRHARAIRIGAVGLAVLCLPLLGGVHFEYNPLRLRVPTADSVLAFDDLMATDGLSPWSVIVLAGDAEEASEISTRLAGLDTVERSVTFADYVPRDQAAKLAILEDVALLMAPPPARGEESIPPTDDEEIDALRRFASIAAAPAPADSDSSAGPTAAALARLHESVSRLLADLERGDTGVRSRSLEKLERNVVGGLPEQLARVRIALEAQPVDEAALPDDLRRGMVAPDGRVRVEAFPRADIGSDDEALRRFVDQTREAVPQSAGLAINAVEAARSIVLAFIEALALAAVAISLLLLAIWRRLFDTLVALAPLALAAMLLCALGVVFNEPFNFANVLALPALLGIGIDSGIHLVHRWRHADSANDDLLHTSAARGVVYSALTTEASFGSLAISPHPGMASIGWMLTIGLALILVANLVLIPALLAGRKTERA